MSHWLFEGNVQEMVNYLSSLMMLISISVLRLEHFLDDDEESLEQNRE